MSAPLPSRRGAFAFEGLLPAIGWRFLVAAWSILIQLRLTSRAGKPSYPSPPREKVLAQISSQCGMPKAARTALFQIPDSADQYELTCDIGLSVIQPKYNIISLTVVI
jgi:hypothetical protein